jgi:hypothetical protein
MSKQAAQLLDAFEALPEEEKRLFAVEVLAGQYHSTPGRWTIWRPLRPPINFSRASKLPKMTPTRGEVWLFDLGIAEKVRPALVAV